VSFRYNNEKVVKIKTIFTEVIALKILCCFLFSLTDYRVHNGLQNCLTLRLLRWLTSEKNLKIICA